MSQNQTTAPLTIAVVGAGGKMGMRVSNNLQRSVHTVYYSENSPAGQQRTVDAGRATVSGIEQTSVSVMGRNIRAAVVASKSKIAPRNMAG